MENLFSDLKNYLLSKRNFHAQKYIADKVITINNFFKENNLDSAVVGISGGIDSAVVYKLLKLASEIIDSPIKNISPLVMPILSKGTTGQGKALHLALEVSGEDAVVYDLSSACKSYTNLLTDVSPWTIGQVASIVRTPMLYGHAAYLQQQGLKSIVVGTTNRDEGSYIGFFGKASDAMVDLQPIADIHKMEVYEIAKLLEVPQEIIDRKPTGDVFDASLDEDTIGAPYWFIQLYLLAKQYNPKHIPFLSSMSKEEVGMWCEYGENIEMIHEKNAHKYKVGMPSQFIDVMPRIIPHGWK